MPLHGQQALMAKLRKLADNLANKAPKVVAAVAERHSKDAFRLQGWTDAAFRAWPRTKSGKPGRILKRTGLLMNSVRIESATLQRIRITAGGPHVPYARIHNEGGTIEGNVQVRAHKRKAHAARTRRGNTLRREAQVQAHNRRMLVYMAKRKFLGRSVVMEANMRAAVGRLIQTTLQ